MKKHNARERRIDIFADTMSYCITSSFLRDTIMHSNNNQKILLEEDSLPTSDKKYDAPTKVIVSQKRTMEAAKAYSCDGKNVCVLNFASATNAGGGVEKGANAQEECLCRCSTLYFNLALPVVDDKFYELNRMKESPLYDNACIYTPDVLVFKTDTAFPESMAEDDWYKVNVISCAAPNLRENPSNEMNPFSGSKGVYISPEELKALHMKRMKRILDVAKAMDNTVIILGAFGCGAFQNPPEIVAEAFATVIKDYLYDFEVIEFAVYCPPKNTTNYDVFHGYLGGEGTDQ